VNLGNAFGSALANNFGGEIGLVMRWTNTGAELHDHVGRSRSEAFSHLRNCFADNAELGAFATGMRQTDSRRFWIDNVNSATVGNVNAQRDTVLIGDNAVTAGKMFIFAADTAAPTICKIDDRDLVPVNLFGRKQRPIADADSVANFALRRCREFFA